MVETVAACPPDGVSAALVLVVGRDVSDRGVQAYLVGLDPDSVELGGEVAGVDDLLQVGHDVPPVLEHLGLAEVEHNPRNNRM